MMSKATSKLTRSALIAFLASGFLGIAVSQQPPADQKQSPADQKQPAATAAKGAAYYAFRNTVDKVPAKHPGIPAFKLSASYPSTSPGDCDPKKECTWLDIQVDFNATFPPNPNSPNQGWVSGNWKDYVQSILNYVKQGQDPELADKVGFRTEVNGKTRWFNVPWMAYDPTAGREFVHGTTNERTAHISELTRANKTAGVMAKMVKKGGIRVNADPNFRGQSSLAFVETEDCEKKYPHGFESWSVGFYNEWGGWAIGRAFPRSGQPHVVDYMGSKMPDGLPFPSGTVVTKVLTTDAPPECVPILKNAPEWHVNRHMRDPKTGAYDCEREVQISRILQVDVAVVDNRAPMHWVYSTFAYDGNLSGTFWDKLVPLGVQWGSDPWTYPAVPPHDSAALQQTVLNPDSKPLVTHYGCENRLAGPVDNPQSSCLSCHGAAFAAPNGAPSTMGINVPPAFGFDGMCVKSQYSLDNAAYFQNLEPPQHFPSARFADAFSLDTSLQLEVAFDQYGHFHSDGQPVKCTNPNQF